LIKFDAAAVACGEMENVLKIAIKATKPKLKRTITFLRGDGKWDDGD